MRMHDAAVALLDLAGDARLGLPLPARLVGPHAHDRAARVGVELDEAQRARGSWP